MKQLRNAILRSFVFYFFGLSIAGGLIEELFDQLAELVFGDQYRVLLIVIGTLFQILAVLLFSFLFYRSLNKKIDGESRKLAKEQSTLFANIAHDLKTPLTSITGFSKALSEDIVEPAERAEAAAIIYQKSQTANELLDLMFQYTKLNSADFSLNRQECDVNLLLKEVIAEGYDLVESHQIELILNLSDKPIMKTIDKVEFRRVFNNLLINACKHNPAKTKLAISIENQMNAIKIIFADTGIPIPDREREKLFQPFVSEDETERTFHGSGLGLAIVKTIIDKHGFTIELLDDERYTKKFVITM